MSSGTLSRRQVRTGARPVPTFLPPESEGAKRALRECPICAQMVRGSEFDEERGACRLCAEELGEAEGNDPSELLVDEAETMHEALTEEARARARGLGVGLLVAAGIVAVLWAVAMLVAHMGGN